MKNNNVLPRRRDFSNMTVFDSVGLPILSAMFRVKPIIRTKPKVGRNEKCNCGCDRKIKRCPNGMLYY